MGLFCGTAQVPLLQRLLLCLHLRNCFSVNNFVCEYTIFFCFIHSCYVTACLCVLHLFFYTGLYWKLALGYWGNPLFKNYNYNQHQKYNLKVNTLNYSNRTVSLIKQSILLSVLRKAPIIVTWCVGYSDSSQAPHSKLLQLTPQLWVLIQLF